VQAVKKLCKQYFVLSDIKKCYNKNTAKNVLLLQNIPKKYTPIQM